MNNNIFKSKTQKPTTTSKQNYQELLNSKLNELLLANSQKEDKLREAQAKLLQIRDEHGLTPQVKEKLEKIQSALDDLQKNKSEIHRNYGVPHDILQAAQRIDQAEYYDQFKENILSMGTSIANYNRGLQKFKEQLKQFGGYVHPLQLAELENNLYNVSVNHSILFSVYIENTEKLKQKINDHLSKRRPKINVDNEFLDDIVKGLI